MKNKEFEDLIKKIEDRSFNETTLSINVAVLDEYREEVELTAEQIILLTAALKKNPAITSLSLYGNNISDESAIVLASITTLKQLDLGYNDITHIGATALAKCPLERLDLSENNIHYKEEYNIQFQEMIKAFGNNKTIKSLNLLNFQIPSIMLGELIKHNSSIELLYLGRASYPFLLTDDVLKFIDQNTVLQTLYLYQTKITDKGISYLGQNKSIKRLHIEESNITDAGIKILSQHSSLKYLLLQDSDLTDVSGIDLIASNLDELNIRTQTKSYLISKSEREAIMQSFYQFRKEKQEDIELQKELEIEEEILATTKMESEGEGYEEYQEFLTNNMYDCSNVLDNEGGERQFKETIQLQETIEEEVLTTSEMETEENSYQEPLINGIIYDSNVLKVISGDSMDTSDFYC